MNAESLRPDQLTADQIEHWRSLTVRVPGFDSPFLDPEYVLLLGEHRRGVEVGLLSEGGATVGFFPFERISRAVGAPAGNRICDMQGVVTVPGCTWTMADLMRGCRLKALHLERVLAAGLPSQNHRLSPLELKYLDISDGYAAYCSGARRRGSGRIADVQRRRRKIERELGPVRFEWHDTTPEAFASLIKWKRHQRRETHSFDVLQFPWVIDFLDHIRGTQFDNFAGVFGTLYVGDRLAAAHLGMRTSTALSVWFQAYNSEFSRYSPGYILLAEIAAAAADRGIRRIELGAGEEPWKRSFASASLAAGVGTLDLKPWRQLFWNGWYWLRNRARPLLASRPVRAPKRLIRSIHDWNAMR